jgi:hypothetical protein
MARFDFSGWKLAEMLKGNKEAFKILIAALVALYVPATAPIAALWAALSKVILDVFDYYVSQ